MARIYRANETLSAPVLAGAACAFGVFDGVHEGHRFIIGSMADHAREQGVPSAVLTFTSDPDELFRPDRIKKLMSNEERIERLASLDVDAVVVLPFDRDIAAVAPDDFLARCFGAHTPSSLHVGHDFRFGAKAAGDVDVLKAWGEGRGMDVFPYKLLEADGLPITATRIRGLLQEGKVEEAGELLGRPYSMHGVVHRGRGEGADMGFATANLHVPELFLALADGVYAAYAFVGGTRYKAAASVGVSPTFAGKTKANVEIHILDFAGNLYGQEVEIAFAHYLRPMMAFKSVDELIATVTSNITWVRENL